MAKLKPLEERVVMDIEFYCEQEGHSVEVVRLENAADCDSGSAVNRIRKFFKEHGDNHIKVNVALRLIQTNPNTGVEAIVFGVLANETRSEGRLLIKELGGEID